MLRFEIEPEQVETEFEKTTREFVREAAIPGFRPGKAPRPMVAKRFEKEIQENTRESLIRDNYKKAVQEHKLSVVGGPDIEEVQFNRGQPMQFIANVEVIPDFPLPEYRGLPARRENSQVTAEDVNQAVEVLRRQKATFLTVERPALETDIVVVNYSGMCEGRPVKELVPDNPGLGEQKGFWLEVNSDAFLPGFARQLLGAKAGEKKEVTVEFPADFIAHQLAGKKASFATEVVEVKERILPAVDDAFARGFEARDLPDLREGVRRDLQNELNLKTKKNIRGQLIRALMERAQFELPDSLVQGETRQLVYEMVSDFRQQGIATDTIDRQKEEIYSMASRGARDRVKLQILVERIADREGITVLPDELNARLIGMAKQYKMPADKLLKELEQRGGLGQVFHQILQEKVLSFVTEHARIEDVQPAEPGNPAEAAETPKPLEPAPGAEAAGGQPAGS